MIKAIIFDLDGVILETADIKTQAFHRLFADDYPQQVGAIVEHHLRNMGISRYVKFKYIYENILHLPLSIEKEKLLGERFSQIVFQEVLKAPFVPGAIKFIRNNYCKYLMFIASGTPNDELRRIVKKRKIEKFFKEICGTPLEKAQIIRNILLRYKLDSHEAVFIGDAQNDLSAAYETGLQFIARNSGNLNSECKYKINNLKNLEEVLIGI